MAIIRQAWPSWAGVSLLVVLCGVLAILQYRWIGEVREGDRTRLREDLQTHLNLLRRNFDDEITSACQALVPTAAQIESMGREDAYLAQYRKWTESHERVFRRIALAVPQDGALGLLMLYPPQARFLPAEWPQEWSAMRDQLTARLEGEIPPPWVRETPSLIELPRFGPAPEGALAELEWLLAELNLDYIGGTLIPEMLTRYLGSSGKLEYDAKVVVNGNPSVSIYQSFSDSGRAMDRTADASVSLLNIRPGAMRIEGPGFREPGLPDGLRVIGRGRFGGESPPPDAGRRRFAGLSPPSDPGPGRWLLLVRHRAGSLEAIVARARWRNMAISAAVLLLILATAAALIRFSRQAQQLAELQMNFVAGVSHELRTPLTVIRTAAYNLRGKLAGRPDDVERYGKLIQHESEKLAALVEQVLLYGSAKAGRLVHERTPVAVAALIENSLLASRAGLEGCKLVVEKTVEADLPPLLADEVAMKHALKNLLDNAVKYGTEGSNWIGLSAAAVQWEKGPAVEIRVADRGPGIPLEERERIFDPFFRGRRAVLDQVHGTGLGLNLVKKIVEAHGGSIHVHSEPMRGTEFVLTIPAAPPELEDEFAHSSD